MASEPPPDAAASPPTYRRPRAWWRAVQAVCVASALVHPLAAALSRHFWLADLLSHFQEPALVVTLLAVAVTASGRRRLAVGLALLAAFQVAPLVRYACADPVAAEPGSPDRLRILMANVLFENERYDELRALIRAEKPDVVGLVEYTPAWRAALADERNDYPYRVEYPAQASGLALWFRKAPRRIDPPEWLVPGRHPLIHAAFDFAGRERHLWVVHPCSPMSRERREAGNPELDAMAVRVRETGGSRVVIGDMNSTDGSAHFRDFLRVSGLRDSRLGFGRQGSWPSDWPYRISIDHAFLSDDLAVVDRRLGFLSGSDHFALIVDLAPAAATNDATQATQSTASPP